MTFEYDPKKAKTNWQKHCVSFAEAEVVVYTMLGELIRLISALRATKQEKKAYEKGI